MMKAPSDWRRIVVWAGWACAICFESAGCGDPITNSGVAHPGNRPAGLSTAPETNLSTGDSIAGAMRPGEGTPTAADAAIYQGAPGTDTATAQDDPAKPRAFEAEGPDGALRVTFDDLDLLKLLKMDPVTPDCIERMPEWLKGLNGKKVRLRGYMKPSTSATGIPQFLFVRSTDLCCFGPKGKVYHLIATTLKQGTTTNYIELKPFDVVGTFRIELVQLDDGLIFLLYHIDDAAIIQT